MELHYNTNGLAHHRLEDVLPLLESAGYQGIALTPDVAHLDPRSTGEEDWRRFGRELARRGLRCTLESGARFLLDPERKHFPNLVTRDPVLAARRIDQYAELCRRATGLGARTLSLWSGAAEPGTSEAQAQDLLLQRLPALLDRAAEHGVTICFEPEPGMAVPDLRRYLALRAALGRDDLGTTFDVGHWIVTESEAVERSLARVADSLRVVHLDDAVRGVHQHLPFGQGEIDFEAVLRALHALDFRGPAVVELSRDSHRAPDALRESAEFLRAVRARLGQGP